MQMSPQGFLVSFEYFVTGKELNLTHLFLDSFSRYKPTNKESIEPQQADNGDSIIAIISNIFKIDTLQLFD